MDNDLNTELEQNIKKAKSYTTFDEIKKMLPSIIILPIAVYWLLNRGEYGVIDYADLVIHEAGHVFFMFFGNFIRCLGGTLMQIIIPSLICYYFLKSNYKTGMQFSLLWLGHNLINISVYAADAQAKVLPLLGGNKAGHDWHYLLGALGILQYDIIVGYFFFGLAIIIFIIAVILPLLTRN
jgi:hypothetical protein